MLLISLFFKTEIKPRIRHPTVLYARMKSKNEKTKKFVTFCHFEDNRNEISILFGPKTAWELSSSMYNDTSSVYLDWYYECMGK